MRVALVHYWIVNWRGGEKVLRAIADLFTGADVYAHVIDPRLAEKWLPGRTLRTTFVARLPFARKHYQKYLGLMPVALEQLDLRSYDLVISSEAGPAKGVITAPDATHICYCHSPMRYVWDMYHEYRAHCGPAMRVAMVPLLHYMRMWDQLSAQRVDHFIANSRFVAQRIEKYYRRQAQVIFPPVAVDDFELSTAAEDFYLSVGQLVAYKRADLMVEAFNALGARLVVIGDGEMLPALRRVANRNVQFLGGQPFEVIRDHYARCRALIFPGVEDFGMVPVEAMASGKPVIAFGRGGVLETVEDGVSGVLFEEQTVHSLLEGIRRFERIEGRFNPSAIRAGALRFSEESFKERFAVYVSQVTSQQLVT